MAVFYSRIIQVRAYFPLALAVLMGPVTLSLAQQSVSDDLGICAHVSTSFGMHWCIFNCCVLSADKFSTWDYLLFESLFRNRQQLQAGMCVFNSIRLRSNGAKVFLLTNSGFEYSNVSSGLSMCMCIQHYLLHVSMRVFNTHLSMLSNDIITHRKENVSGLVLPDANCDHVQQMWKCKSIARNASSHAQLALTSSNNSAPTVEVARLICMNYCFTRSIDNTAE